MASHWLVLPLDASTLLASSNSSSGHCEASAHCSDSGTSSKSSVLSKVCDTAAATVGDRTGVPGVEAGDGPPCIKSQRIDQRQLLHLRSKSQDAKQALFCSKRLQDGCPMLPRAPMQKTKSS